MDRSEYEQIYTIAHELAHVFFEHGRMGSIEGPIGGAINQEIEADDKVIQWGFEEELRKTPYNYKFGDGLKNTGLV